MIIGSNQYQAIAAFLAYNIRQIPGLAQSSPKTDFYRYRFNVLFLDVENFQLPYRPFIVRQIPLQIRAEFRNSRLAQDENLSGITAFELNQNYPNPFNPVTSIQYSVSSAHNAIPASLKIYNILGQKVRTLMDELQKAGSYSVVWDGKDDKGNDMSSGIYFYTFTAGDYSSTRKMTFLK